MYDCAYIEPWGWNGMRENLRPISASTALVFADAATVLHDDYAITIPEEGADEERFVTTGMDALGRVLVVVYTWRESRVRIISARAATPRERRQYERTR